MQNELMLTLQGKQLQLVAVTGDKRVDKLLKFANAEAARAALANFVVGAEKQKAKVTVAYH